MFYKLFLFKKINLIMYLAILVSFIAGFYFFELSTTKSKSDIFYTFDNFSLIINNSYKKINFYQDYLSSRLPLIYFFTDLYTYDANFKFLRFNSLFLSLFSYLIFLNILRLKFYKYLSLENIFLLSSILLISPYFRTASFWPSEEIFFYFCIIISYQLVIFYENLKNKFLKNVCLFFSIFFVNIAFYSSVNFFYFNIAFFFYLINFKKFFILENFKIIFFNIIFLFIPFILYQDFILHLFSEASHVGYLDGHKRLGLDLNNIPQVGSINFLYLLPFLFILFSVSELKEKFYKEKYFFLIGFLVFQTLFFNYKIEQDGGGAIQKLLLFYFDGKIFIFLYLSSAYLGFCTIYIIASKFSILWIQIISQICFYIFLKELYQEYFDPSIILFLIFFCCNLKKYLNGINIFGLTCYFLFFFISTYTYYNYI